MLEHVFGWRANDIAPAGNAHEVNLAEFGETLRPTYAVPDPEPSDNPWLMLIQEVEDAPDLDRMRETDERRFKASPHARFERLLRETRVPIGLLSNGTHLRLVYAPKGELRDHLTFPVAAMAEPAGRTMFAGLHMLLESDRVFNLPRKQRLPHILAESRRYQGEVSTRLAEQVLNAIHELLRGFQAADDRLHGDLLREPLDDEHDRDHVYAGLLTTLLRRARRPRRIDHPEHRPAGRDGARAVGRAA